MVDQLEKKNSPFSEYLELPCFVCKFIFQASKSVGGK